MYLFYGFLLKSRVAVNLVNGNSGIQRKFLSAATAKLPVRSIKPQEASTNYGRQ